MKAAADAGSYGALRQLWDQIKNHENWLPPPEQLQSLGIHASQVALTDDGTLQFEPCFFRPYPTKIKPLVHEFDARRYEFEAGIPDEIQPPFPQNPRPPAYDVFLKEHQETSSNRGDLKAVFSNYCEQLRAWSEIECWPIQGATTLFEYIDWYLDLELDGLFGDGMLTDAHHVQWGPDRDKDYPRLPVYNPWSGKWHISGLHRYEDHDLPKPHLVISLLSGVSATGLGEGLTIHELQAIVNLMLVRTYEKPFCRFLFHPVLVMSYMGPQHGRIIQALYDGERLNIQYSPVWSFEVEESAPVELFLCYHLSQPVGLDEGTLCHR